MRIGPARWGVRRVDTMLAVHLVELLSFRVIGLKLRVADRPSRGDPAVMLDLTKILLAQAEQRRAIHFGIAADPVVDPRMEWLAILAIPGLLCLVFSVHEDGS